MESGSSTKLDDLLKLVAGIEITLKHEYGSSMKDDQLISVLRKKKQEAFDQIRKEIYGTTF